MTQFPPSDDDIVVVRSVPDGDGGRRFQLDQGSGDEVGFDLDAGNIQHEDDLVATMKECGYTLTMVGGGSRSDELRRFYFRQMD